MLHCGDRSALVSEFAVKDVVDRILNTYQLMRPLDPDRVSDSRRKITRYLESLASAGQSDVQQLAVYGLAYLKDCTRGEILGLPAARILTFAAWEHRTKRGQDSV